MKAFYFILIFFNFSLAGQSQVVKNKIRKFTADKNIEIFWVYDYSCNYDIILGNCGWEEPHYLFWRQFDKWNIKRFDYCETFKAIQIDSLDSLGFYLQHFNRIEESYAKRQTENKTIKRSRRRKRSKKVVSAGFICLYTVDYNSWGESKKIVEDAYHLKLEKYNNSKEADHPGNDSQDELKSLILMAEKLIKELNDEKMFAIE